MRPQGPIGIIIEPAESFLHYSDTINRTWENITGRCCPSIIIVAIEISKDSE